MATQHLTRGGGVGVKDLVGSGDRIGLFTLPFVIAGVLLQIVFPSVFAVGGPPPAFRAISIAVLIGGLAIWAWSATLILMKVPRGQLITSGPYALVKHPLYTGVALFVVPWIGFLFNTWLGVPIGLAMYLAARRFAPAEEASLSRSFGAEWDAYLRTVKLGWL